MADIGRQLIPCEVSNTALVLEHNTHRYHVAYCHHMGQCGVDSQHLRRRHKIFCFGLRKLILQLRAVQLVWCWKRKFLYIYSERQL